MSREGWKGLALLVFGGLVVIVAFVSFNVDQHNFGIDWDIFWRATHGLQLDYSTRWLFNPPWSLAVLWPLTIWSFEASLGLYIYISILVLALCVPSGSGVIAWLGRLLVLMLSYPVLRHLADGNLQTLIIAGALLMLWSLERKHTMGMVFALILLSTKVQETWVMLLISAVWIIKTLGRKQTALVAGYTAALCIPFVIEKGRGWIVALGRFPIESPYNSSLAFTLNRLDLPAWFSVGLWLLFLGLTIYHLSHFQHGISRLATGWAMSASLLLAPYAASNSLVVPYAIGVIVLWEKYGKSALLLTVLFNLPFLALFRTELRIAWENPYWTLVLMISWLVLLTAAQREADQDNQFSRQMEPAA